MAKLQFDAEQVRKLYEHALASPSHRKGYGEKGKAKPSLILVKDDGIYLMSNGTPALLADGTLYKEGDDQFSKNFVVYAKGYDPDKDEDVWHEARAAVGGDDFAEYLSAEMFKAPLEAGEKHITLKVTANSIAIEYLAPRTAEDIARIRTKIAGAMKTHLLFRQSPRHKGLKTCPLGDQNRAAIKAKYPKAIILNDMTEDEALEAYLKANG